MPEGQISEQDIETLHRGYGLYNEGRYDELRDLLSADIVLERDSGEPLHGWEDFRAFQEPDAFEWQRLEPLEHTIHDDKILLRVRVRSKGARSGVELDLLGWNVWTFKHHLAVHMYTTFDEAKARAAAGV